MQIITNFLYLTQYFDCNILCSINFEKGVLKMKKIIFMALAIVTLMFNLCAANSYDDNKNYAYVITANQGDYYLNLKTIDVVKYKPPQYQIAASFIHVTIDAEGKEKVSNRYVLLMYDWDTKEIFSKDVYGNWEITNTDESSMNGKVNRKFAEVLFRAAYNVDFFN